MNHIYQYAYDHGILEQDVRMPSISGFHFKPSGANGGAYTTSERSVLLGWLDNHVIFTDTPEKGSNLSVACAIELAFCMDIRIGELRALKWNDINYDAGFIRVDTQCTLQLSGNETGTKYISKEVHHLKAYEDVRYIPLSARAGAVLQKLKSSLPEGPADDAFIFRMMKDRPDDPMRTNHFNRWLERYCNKAGITYRSSHKIRFWANGAERDAGIGADVRKAVSGHKTSSMDEYYDRRKKRDLITEDVTRRWREAFN